MGSILAALVAYALATDPAQDGPLDRGMLGADSVDVPAALPAATVTPLSGGITRPLGPTAGAVAAPAASSGEPRLVLAAATGGTFELPVGHIDLLAPQLVDGELVMTVKDDTRLHDADIVFRDPAEVVTRVKEEARQSVPEGYEFLGSEGDAVWILPQTQDAELAWPGWSSEHPSLAGQFEGPMTFQLTGVEGPGEFVLFQTVGFGTASVIASTTEGLPGSWTEPIPAHVHASWAFSAPGDYTLTFEASGTLTSGGTVSTGPVPYRFVVDGELPEGGGDGDGDGDGGDSGDGGAGGGGAGGGGGGGGGEGALADTGIDDAGVVGAVAVSVLLLGLALIGQPRRRRAGSVVGGP